jgi:hypothetical protein
LSANPGPRRRGCCGSCGNHDVTVKVNGRLKVHHYDGRPCPGANTLPVEPPAGAAARSPQRARASLDLHSGVLKRHQHLLTDRDRAYLLAVVLSTGERSWLLYAMGRAGPASFTAGPDAFARLYGIIQGG